MARTRILTSLALAFCWLAAVSTQNGSVDRLAESNTHFAHRLFNQLRNSSSNFIFSPISMSVALTMTYIGSCETTRQELQDVLGFSSHQLNEQEILQQYRDHLTSMTEPGDGYQFSLANSLFKREDFQVHNNYTLDIKQYFEAYSSNVNFDDSQQTLDLINGWVSNSTHGKISTMLREIDPTAVMILLNAVYFKGDWIDMFDVENTHGRDFMTENGVEKRVQMMAEDLEVKFSSSHPIGASVLELPYKRNVFSMVFVLPDKDISLSTLETRLSTEDLLQLSSHLSLTTVKVIIPKMKLDSDFSMIGHLRNIGIRSLFTDNACLSGISSQPLGVSQVIHKATMEVSEEGCEVSASSSVQFYARSSHHHHPVFIANRPFMFLVRHNPTNTITFMGRFADL